MEIKIIKFIRRAINRYAFNRYGPNLIKQVESLFYDGKALLLGPVIISDDIFNLEGLFSGEDFFGKIRIEDIPVSITKKLIYEFNQGVTHGGIDDIKRLALLKEEIVGNPRFLEELERVRKNFQEALGDKEYSFDFNILTEEFSAQGDVNKLEVNKIYDSPIFRGKRYPLVRDLFDYIFDIARRSIHSQKKFQEEHDISYNFEGEIKTFYNYANLLLHYFSIFGSVDLSLERKNSFFSCSAIHPLYDDYIDGGNFDTTFPERLSSYLKDGVLFDTVNDEERKIIALLEILNDEYPRLDHPLLWDTLCDLHKWQLLSQLQKDDISQNDIVEISLHKGAYAFAFYGYVACGGLTTKQYLHFFSMGCIFQLMDDLHDIEEDLKNGISTAFTKDVNENGAVSESLYGLIYMQRFIERSIPLIDDFSNPRMIRLIEFIGYRYDTARFVSLSARYMDDTLLKKFRRFHLGDFSYIEHLFKNSRSHENLDSLLKLIDNFGKKTND